MQLSIARRQRHDAATQQQQHRLEKQPDRRRLFTGQPLVFPPLTIPLEQPLFLNGLGIYDSCETGKARHRATQEEVRQCHARGPTKLQDNVRHTNFREPWPRSPRRRAEKGSVMGAAAGQAVDEGNGWRVDGAKNLLCTTNGWTRSTNLSPRRPLNRRPLVGGACLCVRGAVRPLLPSPPTTAILLDNSVPAPFDPSPLVTAATRATAAAHRASSVSTT